MLVTLIWDRVQDSDLNPTRETEPRKIPKGEALIGGELKQNLRPHQPVCQDSPFTTKTPFPAPHLGLQGWEGWPLTAGISMGRIALLLPGLPGRVGGLDGADVSMGVQPHHERVFEQRCGLLHLLVALWKPGGKNG